MALTRNQKIGIGIGVAALALGFAGAAGADDTQPDDDDDDDAPPECPAGSVPQIQEDGTWACVPIVIVEPPNLDDVDDDPLPPPPPKCNYSGCGPQFDGTHQHPAVYAQRLSQLGYPINFVAIGQNGSLIAVAPARNIVREFQRDSNAVRASPPAPAASPLAFAPIAAAGKLAEDGFIGNFTIAAIDRAIDAQLNSGMTWGAAVELAAG